MTMIKMGGTAYPGINVKEWIVFEAKVKEITFIDFLFKQSLRRVQPTIKKQ